VAGLDLVSVSGYSVNKLDSLQDLGVALSQYLASPQNLNSAQSGQIQRNETDKFSQELRLSASVGKWLDWLVGGFYTHESDPAGDSYSGYFSVNPATGAVGNELVTGIETPYSFSEDAIFGDVTLHITDRLDLQLGGRESWNRMTYQQTEIGPAVLDLYGASSPDVGPLLRATGNAFTYLVTPQFKLSTDAMVYARIASGYRVGGPNAVAPFVPGIPSDYKPDKTVNYEIGIKDELFDRRLSIDASVYYIRWHDFQLSIVQDNEFFETNAGDAKSEGVELAVQSHPATGLTVTAQGSFNEAELTQDLPPAAALAGAYGLAGDRLPYSIRWSGGITANQDFPLASAWKGFVGGAFTYVGPRPTEFAPDATTLRTQLPSSTTLNLRTGVRHDTWLVNVYVNNAANRRSIIGSTPYIYAVGVTGGYYGSIIQPRTIGLSVVRNF
jgi:iron complex outermembrane receptor protein